MANLLKKMKVVAKVATREVLSIGAAVGTGVVVSKALDAAPETSPLVDEVADTVIMSLTEACAYYGTRRLVDAGFDAASKLVTAQKSSESTEAVEASEM